MVCEQKILWEHAFECSYSFFFGSFLVYAQISRLKSSYICTFEHYTKSFLMLYIYMVYTRWTTHQFLIIKLLFLTSSYKTNTQVTHTFWWQNVRIICFTWASRWLYLYISSDWCLLGQSPFFCIMKTLQRILKNTVASIKKKIPGCLFCQIQIQKNI